MVRYTRYNGYPFPEKNAREWHEEFEDAIIQIDADIAGVSQNQVAKNTVSAAQKLHIPVYSDLNSYPSPIDGDVVYADGSGVHTEGMYAYDGSSWIGPLAGGSDGGGSATLWDDLDDVDIGTLSDRPAAGTAGLWYFTTDTEGAYYDDGNQWVKTLLSPGGIAESDLSFDPVTTTELTNHTDTNGAHHTRYSDSEARGAVTGLVDAADLSGDTGTAGQVLHTDGSQAFWSDSSGGTGTSIATGTFQHTSGGPTELTVNDVTTDELAQLAGSVGPDETDQTSSSYAFNHDLSQRWDESAGSVSADLVVNWDMDPGTDMTFEYTIRAL